MSMWYTRLKIIHVQGQQFLFAVWVWQIGKLESPIVALVTRAGDEPLTYAYRCLVELLYTESCVSLGLIGGN